MSVEKYGALSLNWDFLKSAISKLQLSQKRPNTVCPPMDHVKTKDHFPDVRTDIIMPDASID